jgi:hypothetical protein
MDTNTNCPTGKFWFPSQSEANKDANRIFARTGRELIAYPCKECNGWHHATKKPFEADETGLSKRTAKRRRRKERERNGTSLQ